MAQATHKAPTSSSSTAPKIGAGTFVGRCYQMVQLGSHAETFQGETKPPAPRIRLAWELPDELRVFKPENGEQPVTVGREFKFSMHEKASWRLMLESWRGKKFTDSEAADFDASKLLGVPCLINLIDYEKQDGSLGIKINSVSPLMRGQICPALINPLQSLSLHPDEFDPQLFAELQGFIQEKIKASPEYRAMQDAPLVYQTEPATMSGFGEPIAESEDLPF